MRKNKKKLSKFVKQNSVSRLTVAKIEAKNKWQRVDLNRRPRAYENTELKGGDRLPPFGSHYMIQVCCSQYPSLSNHSGTVHNVFYSSYPLPQGLPRDHGMVYHLSFSVQPPLPLLVFPVAIPCLYPCP